MGSRGYESGADTAQCTMDRVILKHEVLEIRDASDKLRATMEGLGGSGGVILLHKKQCFCCEEFTLSAGTEYEVCSICGWIDDPYQNMNPDSPSGRNPISLNETRIYYSEKKS